MEHKKKFTREQRLTMVYGVLPLVLIVVILQLWLFSATMNAYLAGDSGIIMPALIASTGCFLINLWLLRFLYTTESD